MDRAELAARLPDELPGLLRYARTLVRDPARAEDLVQETAARALERATGFRGDSALATWLHRILHNLAVDATRRHREVPTEDVATAVETRWRDDTYTVATETVIARAEQRDELLEALTHLPFTHRSALVLHDAERLTVADVATIQGVSLPAAKQRLRRGRMMLVSELAGDETRRGPDGVPLRCWQARRHISDYLDGDLPARTAQLVERHLEHCPTCPPLYAALVGTTAALRAGGRRDPDSVVPPDLARRLAGPGSGATHGSPGGPGSPAGRRRATS